MKKSIATLIAFAVISSSSLSIAHAQSKAKKVSIPVIGKTDDGKYPIYDLTGDVDDLKYFSGNTAFTPDDLVGRMKYIQLKDVDSESYYCEWTCKDNNHNTVGLNPQWKK